MSFKCGHRSPGIFPKGNPGNGEDIEGAMQQAPQPFLHSIIRLRGQEGY